MYYTSESIVAISVVPRHAGRLIFLDYEGEGPIQKTLFLVGKVTAYNFSCSK